jgi:hypothetical protein
VNQLIKSSNAATAKEQNLTKNNKKYVNFNEVRKLKSQSVARKNNNLNRKERWRIGCTDGVSLTVTIDKRNLSFSVNHTCKF